MIDPNLLLSIRDLRISFETEGRVNSVIKGIDLDIGKGEIVGLVGESGSGKSVTGLSLCGLLPENNTRISGSIQFDHFGNVKELVGMTDDEFRQFRGSSISMIFQEPMSSLNPVLTCGYQVDEMTRLHLKFTKEQARNTTLELFDKVGLPDPHRIYQSYPHQISGGQIQRVMIAMAISCQPQLLIADEPTTALDVTIQKKILELLMDIRKEFGISILFISHDLGVIKDITSEINVMYRGKIVETGPTQSTLVNPQHPYTKGLIACKPPLNYRPERLPVVSDFVAIEEANDGYTFSPANLSETKSIPKRVPIQFDQAPLLQVDNLVVRYPMAANFWGKTTSWLRAVDDLSFCIYKGETLGIVGESGCGKSTLGRTIVHLEKASTGIISFEGRNLLKQRDSEWKASARQIQIIFQDPYSSLNPKMKIGSAIMEPMAVHGLHENHKGRHEKMTALLEQVGMLPEHADRYPHEFSGGQRQRISIARALGLQPKLLICDESVAALDVSVQSQVLNLLKDLQVEYGLSMLFITHDMSVVNFIADRILVMNQGKVVETGPSEEVIMHPKADYTMRLIDSIPQWS